MRQARREFSLSLLVLHAVNLLFDAQQPNGIVGPLLTRGVVVVGSIRLRRGRRSSLLDRHIESVDNQCYRWGHTALYRVAYQEQVPQARSLLLSERHLRRGNLLAQRLHCIHQRIKDIRYVFGGIALANIRQ